MHACARYRHQKLVKKCPSNWNCLSCITLVSYPDPNVRNDVTKSSFEDILKYIDIAIVMHVIALSIYFYLFFRGGGGGWHVPPKHPLVYGLDLLMR